MSNSVIVKDKLAKYTDNGDLTCLICKVKINNDSLWSQHIDGIVHRTQMQKLTELLQKKQDNTLKPSSITLPPPTGLSLDYSSDEDDEDDDKDNNTSFLKENHSSKSEESDNIENVDWNAMLDDLMNDTNQIQPEDILDDELGIDIDDIDIPDDYTGDPDDYIDEYLLKLKKEVVNKQQKEREDKINDFLKDIGDVEIIDDEGILWKFTAAGFVESGTAKQILEDKISISINSSTDNSHLKDIVIGDIDNEMYQLDKEMEEMEKEEIKKANEAKELQATFLAKVEEENKKKQVEMKVKIKNRYEEMKLFSRNVNKRQKIEHEESDDSDKENNDSDVDLGSDLLNDWRSR